MTVSYQYKVASSTSGGFTRLLFLWRGSLYKLIYRELLIFLIAFDVLSVLYRNLFTDEQKEIFEKLVTYCDTFINLIPLTFILGFYVAYVAARWWQQYEAIPWPDKTMHTIALYVPGNDEHVRILRRTLMRYLNLTLVLVLRSISSAVKKRFPSVDHLIDVGFMTPTEKQIFLSVPNNEFNTYWIPCTWFIHVLRDIKAEYPTLDPHGLKLIMEEFNEFRAKCGLLWSYDWISIPLVYTQVVTLATYSFFAAAVIGRQFVEHSKKAMQMEIDIYVPVFTILQFFFFMGLLKVAEQLINPFGDDDEDFELNWLIDRHTKVSYLGVDTLMLQRPPLVKDKYFDKVDLVLPYTTASVIHKKRTFRGSVHFMQIPENQQDMYLPEIIEEDNGSQYTMQKNRKTSIFSKILQGKINNNNDITKNEEICTTGSWRQTVDDLENGKNRRKKSVIDIVENKHSTASPAVNYKTTFQAIDCPLPNISIHSIKDSDLEKSTKKKVTKHNSLIYASGRRISKHNEKSAQNRRRKSFPGIIFHKDSGTLSRNSSKWSLRKDSLIDSQWKGIRWKPFLKEDQESVASSLEYAKFTDNNDKNEYSYVNKGFTNSTPDGLSNSNSTLHNNTTRIETEKETILKNCQIINCDKKSECTSKQMDKSKTLQDSLV